MATHIFFSLSLSHSCRYRCVCDVSIRCSRSRNRAGQQHQRRRHQRRRRPLHRMSHPSQSCFSQAAVDAQRKLSLSLSLVYILFLFFLSRVRFVCWNSSTPPVASLIFLPSHFFFPGARTLSLRVERERRTEKRLAYGLVSCKSQSIAARRKRQRKKNVDTQRKNLHLGWENRSSLFLIRQEREKKSRREGDNTSVLCVCVCVCLAALNLDCSPCCVSK